MPNSIERLGRMVRMCADNEQVRQLMITRLTSPPPFQYGQFHTAANRAVTEVRMSIIEQIKRIIL